MKINSNIAVEKDNGIAGLGCIARSSNSCVVGGMATQINSSCVDTAEGLAILEAIHLAKSNRWRKVLLEVDSEVIFYSCLKKREPPWRVKPVIEEIWTHKMFFDEMKLSLVRRGAHKCADWVANQAKKEMCPSDWIIAPPSSLFLLLCDDCCSHMANVVSVTEFG